MNYQQLKLDDPGGTIESALAVLSAMTEAKPLTINRITSRDIYTVLGSADGEIVLQALESASNVSPVISRVLAWLQPGAEQGIDICDVEAQVVLNSLVGGSITQQMIDDVISLSIETVLKYPSIRAGDIEYARGLI